MARMVRRSQCGRCMRMLYSSLATSMGRRRMSWEGRSGGAQIWELLGLASAAAGAAGASAQVLTHVLVMMAATCGGEEKEEGTRQVGIRAEGRTRRWEGAATR